MTQKLAKEIDALVMNHRGLDSMVATGDDLEWLCRQLAIWPSRADPDKTCNASFLMSSAARTLAARTPAPPVEIAGEVTQYDREAAADYLDAVEYKTSIYRINMRNGLIDSDRTVQAFRKHRLTAQSASAGMVEALDSIIYLAKHRVDDGDEMGASVWRLALIDIEAEASKARTLHAARQAQEKET